MPLFAPKYKEQCTLHPNDRLEGQQATTQSNQKQTVQRVNQRTRINYPQRRARRLQLLVRQENVRFVSIKNQRTLLTGTILC